MKKKEKIDPAQQSGTASCWLLSQIRPLSHLLTPGNYVAARMHTVPCNHHSPPNRIPAGRRLPGACTLRDGRSVILFSYFPHCPCPRFRDLWLVCWLGRSVVGGFVSWKVGDDLSRGGWGPGTGVICPVCFYPVCACLCVSPAGNGRARPFTKTYVVGRGETCYYSCRWAQLVGCQCLDDSDGEYGGGCRRRSTACCTVSDT